MFILGIETSCDETSVSLVKEGTEEIYTSLASSRDLHEQTGGIVPEIAARKQLESMVPVLEDTLAKSCEILNISRMQLIEDIDAIAVTRGPGLMGSLVVGIEAAKGLSLVWNKPLVGVNHLIGHIYANFLVHKTITFPALALVVSGGHTDLVLLKDHNDMQYLGGTLDDAAGEAFDKTARLLGLSSYKLGGPAISKAAALCEINQVENRLPRPMLDSGNYDFSFSGLKTAVKYLVERERPDINSVAREFENAVVDVLVAKTTAAVKEYSITNVLMGGGVVANQTLRTRMEDSLKPLNCNLYVPPMKLCGDTAAYIASAGFFHFNPIDSAALTADPSLSITEF